MLFSTPIVLLVEDNEDNRIVYTTVLRHFGYEVDEAETGEQGLVLVQIRLPDVILTDISMPGMDGFELTRRFRRSTATATIPIIALTAHGLSSDRKRAMQAGCNDFLCKPCEPRRVVATVGKWLELSRHAGSKAPVAG